MRLIKLFNQQGKDKEVSQLKKQLEAMEQLDRKPRTKDEKLFDADDVSFNINIINK